MSKKLAFLSLLGAVLAPSMALAHPGHGDALGLTHGFMHPLSGLDHVLAMIAVGLYAAQLGGRAVWLLPAAFMVAMIGGGALGYAGIPVPMVEQGIALSVIVMGAAIALGLKLPTIAGMALVATFAIFHGHAHGSEGAGVAAFLPYAFGFISATFLLHITGIVLGVSINRLEQNRALSVERAAGVAGALAGVALLAG